MSSMSSFYGGRQGASFVIVKRFDGISFKDLETKPYKAVILAVDSDDQIILVDNKPVIQDGNNYEDYNRWKLFNCDGTNGLPKEYAEGMVECFEQGGRTTSEVGYGDYVIIDTVSGLGQINNPDNGKVYRRGMNFDGDLGGAEYIGQIVGPQGTFPDLSMGTIEEIQEAGGGEPKEYAVGEGLVPGKDEDTYNDVIKFNWVNIKDELGRIKTILIGFEFPYLIMDLTAGVRSAYDDDGVILTEDVELAEQLDNNDHPFYRKWKLNVPKGVKGDSIGSIHLNYRLKNGATLYLDTDMTTPIEQKWDDNKCRINMESTNFRCYPTSLTSDIVEVLVKNQYGVEHAYYGFKHDIERSVWEFTQTKYDIHEAGDSENIEIGPYDTVAKVWLNDDGELIAKYTYRGDESLNDSSNLIPWPLKIDLAEDGTFSIQYNNNTNKNRYPSSEWEWNNTTHTATKTGKLRLLQDIYIDTGLNHEEDPLEGKGSQKVTVITTDGMKKEIGAPLNYIMEAAVSLPKADYAVANNMHNHLLVLYSDPAYRQWLIDNYPDRQVKYLSTKFGERNDWFDLGYVKGEAGGLHIIGSFTIQYVEVENPEGNPASQGWYEKNGDDYSLTEDTVVDPNKTYYRKQNYKDFLDDTKDPVAMTNNPEDRGWAYLVVDPLGEEILRTVYTYDYQNEKWIIVSDLSSFTITPDQFILIDEVDGENEQIPADQEKSDNLDIEGIWMMKRAGVAAY